MVNKAIFDKDGTVKRSVVMKAMREAFKTVVREHRRWKQPVVLWKDGKVVYKDPFRFKLPEDKRK